MTELDMVIKAARQTQATLDDLASGSPEAESVRAFSHFIAELERVRAQEMP